MRHGTKISAQSSVLPPAAETQLLELQKLKLCGLGLKKMHRATECGVRMCMSTARLCCGVSARALLLLVVLPLTCIAAVIKARVLPKVSKHVV